MAICLVCKKECKANAENIVCLDCYDHSETHYILQCGFCDYSEFVPKSDVVRNNLRRYGFDMEDADSKALPMFVLDFCEYCYQGGTA